MNDSNGQSALKAFNWLRITGCLLLIASTFFQWGINHRIFGRSPILLKTGVFGYVLIALAIGTLLCSLLHKRILTHITTTALTLYTLFLICTVTYSAYTIEGYTVGTGTYIATIAIILILIATHPTYNAIIKKNRASKK